MSKSTPSQIWPQMRGKNRERGGGSEFSPTELMICMSGSGFNLRSCNSLVASVFGNIYP